MPRRFSRAYWSFEEWTSAQPRYSDYTARIARTHARYPSATLSQLRRHPRSTQSPLSAVPRAPPSRVPYALLTARERSARQRSLEVVSESRRGKGSLSTLARRRGIAPKTVRRASGAFRKRAGRWVATRTDKVQRYLKSYEHGERIEVLVSNSRTATLLSRYANAVGQFVETGDASGLREFKGKTYVDALGKTHTFETDPTALRATFERSESDFGAFADLYAEPETSENSA
jgi:ribosomal protein L21E